MLREYCVNVPVEGYAAIEVTANNESEARLKALEKNISLNNIIELVACEKIHRNSAPKNIINRKCTVSSEADTDNIESRMDLVEYMEYINSVDRDML